MCRMNLEDPSVTEFLPVANYPGGNGAILHNTAAVYVEILNRIYIFGGWTLTNDGYRYEDRIWYIDLPSPPPPVPAFDCLGLVQGSYPHPTDCSSFFICLDGEMAGEFKCSSPDLFDPIQQTCNITELVICFFSCEEQGEGLHPYPSDCSKYIVCREESSEIRLQDCPKPLLLRCYIPELVNCSTAV
jgi:hypothetical protein